MAKYLVALRIGGLMEHPEIEYSNLEEIEAESKVEAERQYNRKNNCDFFYGKCIGIDGKIILEWANESQVIAR